jgi:hypothetical protein
MRQLGAGEKKKFSPWNTDRFLDQKGAKSVKRRFDVVCFKKMLEEIKSTGDQRKYRILAAENPNLTGQCHEILFSIWFITKINLCVICFDTATLCKE